MSELRIMTVDGRSGFRPGEAIAGWIAWSLPQAPQKLTLTLEWMTRGKGDVDGAVADSLTVEGPGAAGQKEFSLRAPEFPYSFSGRLLSLVWALKLEATPDSLQAQWPIAISPSGRELELWPSAEPAAAWAIGEARQRAL